MELGRDGGAPSATIRDALHIVLPGIDLAERPAIDGPSTASSVFNLRAILANGKNLVADGDDVVAHEFRVNSIRGG